MLHRGTDHAADTFDYLHVVNWTLGEAGCHVTIDTVRFRLSLVVDDPTQVPAVRAEVLITASGELGPLQASIQDVGSWLGYDPGQSAGLERFMGFVPPSGMRDYPKRVRL